jgi:EAL domain-containing protein (putative c-di-GMP-specific phosphodiesterase class I)/GGDEF domain-containing protein
MVDPCFHRGIEMSYAFESAIMAADNLREVKVINEINEHWQSCIDVLEYAFQPLVNIHTGVAIGHEALLRNYQQAGFASIQGVFDAAYVEKVLFKVDLALREKAISQYARLGFGNKAKMFFNLDNRVLGMPDYVPGYTTNILKKYNFHPGNICFEISERHDLFEIVDPENILNQYKKQYYKIAIDDFGAGYCGLQLLYQSEPDYIKIDRYFIKDIAGDAKKKLFVSNIVNIAHILGIVVVAEGVETETEFSTCKKVGCDLVQGYLIQRPTTDMAEVKIHYEAVEKINRQDKRLPDNDEKLIYSQMIHIKPLDENSLIPEVFEAFKINKGGNFFPVINSDHEPVGIIRENDFKAYIYSPFGKEVLANKSIGKRLKDFAIKCPVSEVSKQAEKILEIFTLDEDSEGIIITENGRYRGFLTAKSMLRILNEKNLTLARDQNPLTKLPGNNLINQYLSKIVSNDNSYYYAVYLDFDNFKPFNDRYGFRTGDRAIIMFTEILKKHLVENEAFIGHIGGDDFFVGFEHSENNEEHVFEKVSLLIKIFCNDVTSLYDAEDREQGYIISRDREGAVKKFPMLSVSAAVLKIPPKERTFSADTIGSHIACLKKKAKTSPDHIASSNIYP